MSKLEIKGLRPGFAIVPLFMFDDVDPMAAGEEFVAIANGEHADMERLLSEADRQQVLRWINALPAPKRPLLMEIAGYLQKLDLSRQQYNVDTRSGKIEFHGLIYVHAPSTMAALAWMMTALLSRGHGNNLRKCRHKPCGRWFFDLPRGRVVKDYCSAKHRNAAGQARHRATDKRKKVSQK